MTRVHISLRGKYVNPVTGQPDPGEVLIVPVLDFYPDTTDDVLWAG